ncbi:MAG: hypothetical protein M3Y22_13220, partial [Pseudomonadota bacterium]|nr:hypothetical protein [Pseudomonadota bacterium]
GNALITLVFLRMRGCLRARAGLELRSVSLVDVHGTSFAFVLAKPDADRDISGFLTSAPYGVPCPASADDATGSADQYNRFGEAADARMARVREILAVHRAAGRAICFVGAAAKAITFLHTAGIKPDHVFDEAPLKVGRYIPVIDLPIQPLADIVAIERPLIVIAAWNFRSELTAKIKRLMAENDLRFLVYFPEVEEYQ